MTGQWFSPGRVWRQANRKWGCLSLAVQNKAVGLLMRVKAVSQVSFFPGSLLRSIAYSIRGYLLTEDEEKAKVLNAAFASVFNSHVQF